MRSRAPADRRASLRHPCCGSSTRRIATSTPPAQASTPGCGRRCAPQSVRRSRASASWRSSAARTPSSIAGDLFERSEVGPAALHHALARLARVREAGIAVILASGNHDPGRALEPLAQAGCTLALTHEPVTLELTGDDGAPLGHVVAIGHAGASESANLAALMPPAPGPVSIAVLHAQVDGAAGARDRYSPVRRRTSIAATPTGRSDTSTSASRSARGPPPGTPAASRRTMRASPAPRARSSWRSTARAARRSNSCRSRRSDSSACGSTMSARPASPASRARRGAPWRRPSPARRARS